MAKQFIVIFCICFSIGVLLIYLLQRQLIYFPLQKTPMLINYGATDMQTIVLKTTDQVALTSWYKPALAGQPTLLFLHGNAGHIGYRMPLVREFIKAGMGVFLLEYRGYGGNKGKPTEQGFYEDARTALRFLLQQGLSTQQIVLYGESLGTGVATQLGIEHPFCAVVLQSPFTSLTSLARYHYPWLFLKPWDRYDSLSRITKLHAPLLVLHGKRDQIVPYEEGVTLFNQAVEPKKMLTFDLKNHNDIITADNFANDTLQFINTYCHP